MTQDELLMICCSDIAGQVRGKAIPRSAIEERRLIGVGWTPTNIMITAFGPIADSPWGALGDLILRPDYTTETRLRIPGSDHLERFVLGDILHTDGRTPWACCLRSYLRHALQQLAARYGLSLNAAFEHEFHYSGAAERPGDSYNLEGFRRQGDFGDRFTAALRQAGIAPDTFMPEYGPGQFEVTVKPARGVTAADQAVILRELARATAHALDARASFTPIRDPDGVGNGVHVHFSLIDSHGLPVSHDPNQPHGISRPAAAFVAGILDKLPDFLALTAASTISYLRLTPHRWSAAFNNLGRQDREAAVRLCPVFDSDPARIGRQFHFEFRAADAAASPYLLLGTLVRAGLHGLEHDLPLPEPTTEDLALLDEATLESRGLRRLPQSLHETLDRLEQDPVVRDWLGPELAAAYLGHKRCEAGLMAGLDPREQCARYAEVY